MASAAKPAEDLTRLVPCPVCGALSVCDFLVRADGRRLLRCLRCQAGVVDPMPSEAELQKIYLADYFLGGDDFFAGRSYYEARDQSLREGQVTGIDELRRFGNLRGVHHLDVGCASGTLLVLARDLGAEVTGIDFSPEACAEGRARYGLTIHQGTIESAPIPPGSQDLITGIDLIEHVIDPDAFMKRVSVALRRGGTLIVSTPNFRCARVLGQRWLALEENMEHLVYFSPPSLRFLAGRHGMRITKVYTKGHPMLRRKAIAPSPNLARAPAPAAQSPSSRGPIGRRVRDAARRTIDVLSGMMTLGHELVVWAVKN